MNINGEPQASQETSALSKYLQGVIDEMKTLNRKIATVETKTNAVMNRLCFFDQVLENVTAVNQRVDAVVLRLEGVGVTKTSVEKIFHEFRAINERIDALNTQSQKEGMATRQLLHSLFASLEQRGDAEGDPVPPRKRRVPAAEDAIGAAKTEMFSVESGSDELVDTRTEPPLVPERTAVQESATQDILAVASTLTLEKVSLLSSEALARSLRQNGVTATDIERLRGWCNATDLLLLYDSRSSFLSPNTLYELINPSTVRQRSRACFLFFTTDNYAFGACHYRFVRPGDELMDDSSFVFSLKNPTQTPLLFMRRQFPCVFYPKPRTLYHLDSFITVDEADPHGGFFSSGFQAAFLDTTHANITVFCPFFNHFVVKRIVVLECN